MSLELARPGYLLLLLALLPVLAALRRSRADLPRARRTAATLLRVVIVVALVLALAGLRRTVPADRTTVMFVVDRSLSAASSLEWAERFVGSAARAAGPEDRFGVLTFGENAMLELPPGHHEQVGRFTTQVNRDGSDLAGAIRFASASFPADSARRVVLLSDGNQTAGDAVEEAQLAASLGVEVWTVPVPDKPGPEALVESVEVTGRPVAEAPFDLRILVASTRPGPARLTVTRAGRTVVSQPVELEAGRNLFFVPQRADEAGAYQYTARIEFEQDGNPANNKAQGVALVSGPSRVLYVVGASRSPGPVPAMLERHGIRVEVVDSGGLPQSLAEWQPYDAVFLDDVSAFEIPRRQMEWMAALTRDLGKGLAMLGGPDAYGVGGYLDTPVAEALPVELDIRKKKNTALVGLAMAIDKSGSMASAEGNLTKMDLAREAAIAAVNFMTPFDQVGVVGFDSAAKWVVKMRRADDKGAIAEQIASLRAGGGTNLYPALDRALDVLEGLEVPLKHVIILSDGQVEPGDYDALAERAAAGKITLTTVAVGADADRIFLADLATKGRGRAYLADSASLLPRIFLRDTVIASRAAFSEQPFRAVEGEDHPVLRGVDLAGSPALGGYNLASPRGAPAQVLLEAPKGDPLLAVGRYGLGKTMAWTSDVGRRWATAWADWPGFSTLLVQGARWLLPEAEDPGLRVTTEKTAAGRVRVTATLDGTAEGGLTGHVVTPDGRSQPLDLLQVGPRRFEGAFTPGAPGSYLLRVADQTGGRGATRAWVLPYSPEQARFGNDEELLGAVAAAGSGRFGASPEEVFADPTLPVRIALDVWQHLVALAILLLPLEVGVRRVFLPRRKKGPAVAETPVTAPDEGRLSQLRSAKSRAAASEPAVPPRRLPKLQPTRVVEEAPPPETPPEPTESPLERLKRAKDRARD